MGFNPLSHPILFTDPLRNGPTFTWKQHIPFAMLMVDLLRPRTIVELGTHHGDSYCAMCQAVSALKLDTICRAIDTWKGDPHACFYGPEVLATLRQHHDPLYGSFSQLMQMDFDSAVSQFEDGSIDLLHIDGYHTYDAVRHDYETYKNKVSDRGVVIFHDTAVRHKDFGVYKFWEEISPQFPSFSFDHGCGLGVLAHGPNVPAAFMELLNEMNVEEAKYKGMFAFFGANVERTALLQSICHLNAEIQGVINQWKQQTHQQVAQQAAPQGALSQPVTFTRTLGQDVLTVLNADLAHRQQLMRYLNPPQQAPAAAPPAGPQIKVVTKAA